MAYATCFTDTNGRGVDYYLQELPNPCEAERTLRDEISASLETIRTNCANESYNGGTSRIVEAYLEVAYQMIVPMGRTELEHFRDLIKPIGSSDIEKSNLEERLNQIEQLAYH
jgi:hypothetical protein